MEFVKEWKETHLTFDGQGRRPVVLQHRAGQCQSDGPCRAEQGLFCPVSFSSWWLCQAVDTERAVGGSWVSEERNPLWSGGKRIPQINFLRTRAAWSLLSAHNNPSLVPTKRLLIMNVFFWFTRKHFLSKLDAWCFRVQRNVLKPSHFKKDFQMFCCISALGSKMVFFELI